MLVEFMYVIGKISRLTGLKVNIVIFILKISFDFNKSLIFFNEIKTTEQKKINFLIKYIVIYNHASLNPQMTTKFYRIRITAKLNHTSFNFAMKKMFILDCETPPIEN